MISTALDLLQDALLGHLLLQDLDRLFDRVANFNFHSASYQWLVVSSFKAQFRGTGSVNGVSGYDFRLTAYDGQISGGGGIDKFRIKITRNGQTIFDNRMGVPEDPDVADPQAISGGSIVIHK